MSLIKKILYRPSAKAQEVWRRRDEGRIRLLEGAVRSSKSYTANDLAIHEIQKLPPCDVLISGHSISSVGRNVIAEWKKAIDPKNRGLFQTVRDDKDEYLKINWRGLKDKKFYVRGANKENDFEQIQGSTFGYWLADELTLHAESFVNMALSRLSQPWSRATWTTNPDHPLHFVKKRFIDDGKLYVKDPVTGMAEMVTFTFYLGDNPSLSRSYVESLKKLYTGVFKARYIDSQWVMAEGAIYDFFTEGVHTTTHIPMAVNQYVGIDYGTNNPTCYLEFGRNDEREEGEPRIWAQREYYYDSKVTGRQKDDDALAEDFCDFVGVREYDAVIYDPSALSLILAIQKKLAQRGRSLIFKSANNDVLDGIKTQARMLTSGEYRVGINCRHTIADYGAYVWDPKAAIKKGKDAPIKQNDHTKDVERYVLHTLFNRATIDYEEVFK